MDKTFYYQIVVAGRPLTPISLRPTVDVMVADIRFRDPKAPIQVYEVCHYDITSEFSSDGAAEVHED